MPLSNLPDSNQIRILARRLIDFSPSAAAEEMIEFPPAKSASFLVSLVPKRAARLIEQLPPLYAVYCLEIIKINRLAKIFEHLPATLAAALYVKLSSEKQQLLIETLNNAKAKELRSISAFPPATAGAIMDPVIPMFWPDTRVQDVLNQLRKFPEKELRDIFVVDKSGVFQYAVSLQTLACALPGKQLQALKTTPILEIQSIAGMEEMMSTIDEKNTTSVAVVDIDRHLLGTIRRDQLIQAAQVAASADVQSMVGAGRDERALSPALFVVRKRLPWLVINLATAFLAAAVVGVFESTIAKFTALAVLLPVVAGQSGNTGAQALAVTMRGLALREVRLSHTLWICLKELKAGFLNGFAVAVITAGAVYIWSQSLGLALVIILSMIISMMAAGFSGAIIPMVLTMLRQDPAQSSSIVLTTVTDVVGFLSFLGIATLLSTMI